MARIIKSSIPPKPLAVIVGGLFGRRPPPFLEKRTIIKGGKPLASAYVKVR